MFHARLEPAWRIPTPPLWLGIAISLALVAVAAASSRAAPRLAAVAHSRCCWGSCSATLLRPSYTPRELELTAIDVGQGDGLFLAFPDGKTMLLDGGGIPAFGRAQRSNLDIGEDVIAPYLWDRGIRRVDVIALSHEHEDHVGGLPALVADFRPAELWTGAAPAGPGMGSPARRREARRSADPGIARAVAIRVSAAPKSRSWRHSRTTRRLRHRTTTIHWCCA